MMSLADQVWVAAATLHHDQPQAADFSVTEIQAQARRLGYDRPGLYAQINAHAVANRPPSPGRSRMLLKTAPDRRRLFRPGDPFDPRRAGSRTHPSPEALASTKRDLWNWYQSWCQTKASPDEDPLLAIWGAGRDLWADEPADEYIERLRRDW